MNERSNDELMRAEFDAFADNYYDQHKDNVAITGEFPEFFSKYKVADLSLSVGEDRLLHNTILDFGSGIGGSVESFREYFPNSSLYCADVSERSLEISRQRFPGSEQYILIDESIPLPDNSIDIVFTACVFHHIPHVEHRKWLSELMRITRPGGMLVIFEHNPWNPLTVRAVNTCPIDANAHLISSRAMKNVVSNVGWNNVCIEYKLFFPSFLRWLRPLEKLLSWCLLGAQWRLVAIK